VKGNWAKCKAAETNVFVEIYIITIVYTLSGISI